MTTKSAINTNTIQIWQKTITWATIYAKQHFQISLTVDQKDFEPGKKTKEVPNPAQYSFLSGVLFYKVEQIRLCFYSTPFCTTGMTAGWFSKKQVECGTHVYITIFQKMTTTLLQIQSIRKSTILCAI